MATTLAARRLSEAHRLAQARLGAVTVRRVLTLWPLLDPSALDDTFDDWLRSVVPVVQAQRATSATLAANYYSTFRLLELGAGAPPAPAVLADPADLRVLTTSMLVTGPIAVKVASHNGLPIERAVEIAQARSSGAAMRHALNGGRETITRSARRDPRASGYRRTASGNACAYCADLDGTEFADDEVFRPHDTCQCSAEPVLN